MAQHALPLRIGPWHRLLFRIHHHNGARNGRQLMRVGVYRCGMLLDTQCLQ